MSIRSNDKKYSHETNGISKPNTKSSSEQWLTPEVMAKLFIPFSQVGGNHKKMSSVKPNPNHKLSKEHIEILKRELGVVEEDNGEDGNHEEKKE